MTPRRWLGAALALFAGLLAIAPAPAETCLSPFVKRLDRPEKYLYVFCVDADAKDNDFLAVLDVQPESSNYGKIIHQLDLGSSGNETHHFGFTDDRTHIWGCSLFSSRIFVINVADDPARPRLVKSFDSSDKTGFTGPHSPYALPGRMLISYLGGKDGGLPAGLAEFDNDGTFVRKFEMPKDAPYGYDVAIKPDINRMVTSSFTSLRNYKKPLAKMDLKDFGKDVLIWDFRERKVLQKVPVGAAPLECRWALQDKANYGFTNCALDDSIWVWEWQGGDELLKKELESGAPVGQRVAVAKSKMKYAARKLCSTGKLPADLRQSPDGRLLYVSCFVSNEIQQWDVSDLKKPRLASTVVPGVQPNMMHLTGDGKRMYVTNSLLSTMDRADTFWVRLVHVGPDGMKVDPFFNVDLTKFKTGPARGHDMLLY